MTSKLTEYLTRLSTDEDLVRVYKQDKVAAMKAYGIDDKHIEMIVNKKYAEIQSLLGADFDVAKNEVIKAFKN